jgi:hypothetical protein
MDHLKPLIESVFLDELRFRGSNVTVEDVEVIAFLHTSGERGNSKHYTFQSCVGLARIVSAGESRFMLGSIGKAKKRPWGPHGMECGDRHNPTISPFEIFESRPTPAQVSSFLEERFFFDMLSGDRVVSEFRAPGVQGNPFTVP